MNHDKSKLKILFLIQLPPPVHGVSIINQLIWESKLLEESTERRIIKLDYSESIRSLRKLTIGKIMKFFRIKRELKKTLLEFRPDYVYFSIMAVGWGFCRDFFLARVIRKAGIKPVYHLHNRGIQQKARLFLNRSLYQYVFRDSRIIHLSPVLLRNEIVKAGLNPETSRAIGNGIQIMDLEFKRPVNDEFRILFISNLFPGKGIYLLPVILKDLLEKEQKIQLRVVGNFMRKRYEFRFRKEMQKYGIGRELVLCGEKYGMEKWNEYLDADLFLFPSVFKQECYPLVLLEAMQAGLPVVTSNLGAIPEIISDGKSGFIVQNGDIKAFVTRIVELIRDPDLRVRMGKEARNKFIDLHTADRMEQQIKDFIFS